MGLEPLVAYEHRLPTLTTIKVPPGVDAKKAVSYILEKYQIEIGNGLGDLAGKCWRVGAWGGGGGVAGGCLRVQGLGFLVLFSACLAGQGCRIRA